ncbi:uncharacterized protein LOC130636167 [Hydractinia symbiolongicarpus]|uniref:uncharacterized protein LOC130636167 n=1 Tax=Hydractinia symbiolongicarpus TaxID=13093 RepID=UPI00254D04EF|nr:uncharacterized protein LOC130636167 [Hydractinia symbiolongicarpus]
MLQQSTKCYYILIKAAGDKNVSVFLCSISYIQGKTLGTDWSAEMFAKFMETRKKEFVLSLSHMKRDLTIALSRQPQNIELTTSHGIDSVILPCSTLTPSKKPTQQPQPSHHQDPSQTQPSHN